MTLCVGRCVTKSSSKNVSNTGLRSLPEHSHRPQTPKPAHLRVPAKAQKSSSGSFFFNFSPPPPVNKSILIFSPLAFSLDLNLCLINRATHSPKERILQNKARFLDNIFHRIFTLIRVRINFINNKINTPIRSNSL